MPTPNALNRCALSAGLLFLSGCLGDGDEPRESSPPCVFAPGFDDGFYQKFCMAEGGLPIMASGAVSDRAMSEASNLVVRLLGERPALRDGLVAQHARVSILGEHESLAELPESGLGYGELERPLARGLAFPQDAVAVAAEENVLCWATDDYPSARHSTLLHELGHLIHLVGLKDTTRPGAARSFGAEVRAAYRAAMKAGLWADTYAATDDAEYWAEGVGIYFIGARQAYGTGESVGLHSRDALADYDPALFELLHWAFGDDDWYPHCPELPPAPIAGRHCAESVVGGDVVEVDMHFGLLAGTVSGTLFLPQAATPGSQVEFRIHGRSDRSGPLKLYMPSSQRLTPGAQEIRFAIHGVPRGHYLVSADVRLGAFGTSELPASWLGTYNSTGDGVGSDAVRVGMGAHCDVDFSLSVETPLEPVANPALLEPSKRAAASSSRDGAWSCPWRDRESRAASWGELVR